MNTELENRQVLIVGDRFSDSSCVMERAIGRLIDALEEKNISSITAEDAEEALPLAATNMDIDAFLVATDMKGEPKVRALLNKIKERQGLVPVFLMADRAKTSQKLSPELMKLANEFVWIFEEKLPGMNALFVRNVQKDGFGAQAVDGIRKLRVESDGFVFGGDHVADRADEFVVVEFVSGFDGRRQ